MFRTYRLLGLTLLAALAGVSAAAAANSPAKTAVAAPLPAVIRPPATATRLSAADLTALFSGKSWIWSSSGAGYFAPDRSFLGWYGSGIGTVYGDGRWTVSNLGRICTIVTWHSRYSAKPKRSCYMTVESNGDIYQRDMSGPKWYFLKHAKTEQYDEINNLVAGDKVSNIYAEAKLFVHRKSITSVPAGTSEFAK